MDSPEQNVVASAQLPKPAALQDTAQDAFATSTGTSIFDAKGISIYYGSFRAVTDVSPYSTRWPRWKKAVRCETRAACCILWVTITIA